MVVQRRASDVESIRGVDQPLILVVEETGDGKVEAVTAGQGAALVVETGGTRVE
ncbi:hypothetical protein D3C71_2226700 [compost metagenome]